MHKIGSYSALGRRDSARPADNIFYRLCSCCSCVPLFMHQNNLDNEEELELKGEQEKKEEEKKKEEQEEEKKEEEEEKKKEEEQKQERKEKEEPWEEIGAVRPDGFVKDEGFVEEGRDGSVEEETVQQGEFEGVFRTVELGIENIFDEL